MLTENMLTCYHVHHHSLASYQANSGSLTVSNPWAHRINLGEEKAALPFPHYQRRGALEQGHYLDRSSGASRCACV